MSKTVQMEIREVPPGLALAAYKAAVARGDRFLARCYGQQFLRTVGQLTPFIAHGYLQAYREMERGL